LPADDAIASLDVYGHDGAVHRREQARGTISMFRGACLGRSFLRSRNQPIEIEIEHALMPGKARGPLHAGLGKADRTREALLDRDLDGAIAQSNGVMVRTGDG